MGHNGRQLSTLGLVSEREGVASWGSGVAYLIYILLMVTWLGVWSAWDLVYIGCGLLHV